MIIDFWFSVLAFLRAILALAFNKPFASSLVFVSFCILISAMEPFLLQWRHEKDMLDSKKISTTESRSPTSVTTGDIKITGNMAPTQVSVGSPGSTQVINQQRKISSQAKVEKGKDGNSFILRLILTQTEGMWDSGTDFRLQVKTTGPFKSSNIVKGLPPAQVNVRISENKEQGYFDYTTTTAPMKNEPIVLEILSNQDIDISSFGVEPL